MADDPDEERRLKLLALATSKVQADYPLGFKSTPPAQITQCDICGCTPEFPCRPPCKAVAPAICSHCYAAREYLVKWFIRGPKSNLKKLFDDVDIDGRIWDMTNTRDDG